MPDAQKIPRRNMVIKIKSHYWKKKSNEDRDKNINSSNKTHLLGMTGARWRAFATCQTEMFYYALRNHVYSRYKLN